MPSLPLYIPSSMKAISKSDVCVSKQILPGINVRVGGGRTVVRRETDSARTSARRRVSNSSSLMRQMITGSVISYNKNNMCYRSILLVLRKSSKIGTPVPSDTFIPVLAFMIISTKVKSA